MFFVRVTAMPGECLIVMRGGKAANLGNGASAKLWPWDSYALVPTTAIEHNFQMHQESSDGITLRFKGIIIFRIVDPELAATRFSFQGADDVKRISQALGDICLGELRAIVAGMSMDACIQQRKTVLTSHLQDVVIPVIDGSDGHPGWGVKVDVLQVSQVFCPDEKLLAQLQAEARDQIRKTAQFSEIETGRALQLVRIEADREVNSRNVELEKERLEEQRSVEERRISTQGALRLTELENHRVSEEKRFEIESRLKVTELENHRIHEEKRIETEARLKVTELESRKIHEEKRIETEAALRLLEIQRQMEIAEQELELKEVEARTAAIVTESEALRERLFMQIRKEILPIEQLPEVSAHLSGMFKDARLSVYGDGRGNVVQSATELVDLIFDQVRDALPRPTDAAPR